uniref:SNT1501 n=1 Tax=Arundo donax TaxID=35708 RepID=A0A0A9G2K6_ARUDO
MDLDFVSTRKELIEAMDEIRVPIEQDHHAADHVVGANAPAIELAQDLEELVVLVALAEELHLHGHHEEERVAGRHLQLRRLHRRIGTSGRHRRRLLLLLLAGAIQPSHETHHLDGPAPTTSRRAAS